MLKDDPQLVLDVIKKIRNDEIELNDGEQAKLFRGTLRMIRNKLAKQATITKTEKEIDQEAEALIDEITQILGA